MELTQIIQRTLSDTLGPSLAAFRPELILCATIVLLLLARMLLPRLRSLPFLLTFLGAAGALAVLEPWRHVTAAGPSMPVATFTGMLVNDGFGIFFRSVLLVFAVLFVLFVRISKVPDEEDATEFFVLFLGATLGMCLMVSANHMLIVFLGMEMASVPSFVLAGFLKNKRVSGEAALKFAVFGGGTAGVMLYGITLLGGVLGSFHLPTMAERLAELAASPAFAGYAMVLVLGALMVMVGLAFKLSAVPFHFWAPDVFEGSTAEVAAYLSVASKAAALALLVRVTVGLVSAGPHTAVAAEAPVAIPQATAVAAQFEPEASGESQAGVAAATEPRSTAPGMNRVRAFVTALLALFAVVTCTLGNLAAYGQQNIKRLLAYSTIAHAGYMIMPVAAAVALWGVDPETARWALATLCFYVAIYLFMNLGAFAAAAFLRNHLGTETIDDYAGLVRRSPAVAVCLALILFSLVGMPPLAGFAAKFAIFAALTHAGLITLLVVGAANTVLSLFYYLRVAKVMVLEPESEHSAEAPPLSGTSTPGLFLALMTAPIVILGVWWQPLFAWASVAAGSLFR